MARLINVALIGAWLLFGGQSAWAEDGSAIRDLRGSFVQGGLIFGRLPPGAQLHWGERRIAATAAGEFVVGFDRDAPPSVSLTLTLDSGESIEQPVAIAQRDYPVQRIEGISPRIMAPNAGDLARIRAEGAAIGAARARRIAADHFLGPFKWPLVGPITGVFGSQRVYNGVPKRPHYGVDVAAPVGTTVRAPAAGRVTLVHSDMFYSGGTLIIDHGYGLSSSFLHLSRILVDVGSDVEQGQIVAEVGNTGRVTGAHLDWRMNWHDQRVDPQLLAGAMPEKAP